MVRKPLDFGRKPFTIGKMKAILWAIQRWPRSIFLSNFLIFPHQTRHVRPTKHKICNVNACFSCDVWSQRCGPVPGPQVWPIFHQCQKLSYFPKKLQLLSGRPLFWWFRWIKHLKTLWKMLGNMKFGSVVLKLWSETIPWTHVPFGNILGIQEPLTSKLMRIWGCSLFFMD